MKEVPIEAAVKYIVRDRNKQKDKVGQLTEYAKKLEAKIRQLEGDMKHLRKENAAFHSDYKKSNWYQNLTKTITDLRTENKALWRRLNHELVEERKNETQ